MSTNHTSAFEIIELDDSSSDESQSTTNNNQEPTWKSADKSASFPIPDANSAPTIENDIDEDSSSQSSSQSSSRILTRRQFVEQLPVASRTKRANKNAAVSMRLVSLNNSSGRQEGLSHRSLENIEKIARLESKKKNALKEKIHEAVASDMKDPELGRLLNKIAYCRVFTNYLFRQYDMLTIDFQLYSNPDDLMLNLKRRVGAYNAIRRSRLQILLGSEGNSGGGSNSSREGSTV